MKALADGAMTQVAPDQFFKPRLSEGDNSIATIVKHLGGNLLSRWTDFLTADGEKPGRNRDTEFEISAEDTQAALLQQWEKGWSALFGALEPLTDKDLDRTITIHRGEPLSVSVAGDPSATDALLVSRWTDCLRGQALRWQFVAQPQHPGAVAVSAIQRQAR